MAQQHRCVATAVLEYQHLAAVAQRRADHVQHFRREPGLQRPLAHVEDAHRRRFRIARAAAQAQVRVAPGLDVVQRLQRRRGAAEQHRHAHRLGPDQGEIAGVVADAVLLLVAGIVLFIDHDQPGLRQGREHRRTRADDDPCLSAPRRGPCPRALVVVEPRMKCMHGHAEAGAEARQRLRGQADLRHQH